MEFKKKELPKIEIKQVFPKEIKDLIGEHGFGTLKVDQKFGQPWNLSNLTMEDVYYFGNTFYRDIISDINDMRKKCLLFYQTLISLNPELKNIETHNNIERILDVIRGVGSGLHYNDIKYFVEELNGSGENESKENQKLWREAYYAYMTREGFNIDKNESGLKDESVLDEGELKRFGILDGKIGYVFSPETCLRIIENKPYS